MTTLLFFLFVGTVLTQNCTVSYSGVSIGCDSRHICVERAENGTIYGECECPPKFAGDNCDYERKSQLVAFLLELILGIFAGNGVPGT